MQLGGLRGIHAVVEHRSVVSRKCGNVGINLNAIDRDEKQHHNPDEMPQHLGKKPTSLSVACDGKERKQGGGQ